LWRIPRPGRLALFWDEVPWWLDGVRRRGSDAEAKKALGWLRHLRQHDAFQGRLRMILTGSVGLAGLATQLEAAAELNDLVIVEVGPLAPSDGAALFAAELARRGQAASPAATATAHLQAGGSPHWIKQLAARAGPSVAQLGPADVGAAVESLLTPRMRHLFQDEGRAHLRRRHGSTRAELLSAILDAVSATSEGGPVEAALGAALAPTANTPRQTAEEALYQLVDEFYLDIEGGRVRFVNPLFRRWWVLYGRIR